MVDILKIENCKIKMQKLTIDENNKLIYQWVKQSHISYPEFVILIEYNYNIM